MLPLGMANNLIPQRSAVSSFAQQSDQSGATAGNSSPNQAPAVLRDTPLSPPINYASASAGRQISSLGAEGGLFQAIGPGSAASAVGLAAATIQKLPSINNGPPPSLSYPSEGTRTFPSSLSSSGSLANLGIALPQQFDPPASDFDSSVPVGIDTTATFPPPPPLKDVRPTDQPPLIGSWFMALIIQPTDSWLR